MAANDKELANTLAAIEKEFGQGSIMKLGDAVNNDVTGISTGSLSLDVALGGKGLPRGRVIEIYGNESSGKTTIALHAVANAQKQGGVAAYIDAEHALDPSWAKRIGAEGRVPLVPRCRRLLAILSAPDLEGKSGKSQIMKRFWSSSTARRKKYRTARIRSG